MENVAEYEGRRCDRGRESATKVTHDINRNQAHWLEAGTAMLDRRHENKGVGVARRWRDQAMRIRGVRAEALKHK